MSALTGFDDLLGLSQKNPFTPNGLPGGVSAPKNPFAVNTAAVTTPAPPTVPGVPTLSKTFSAPTDTAGPPTSPRNPFDPNPPPVTPPATTTPPSTPPAGTTPSGSGLTGDAYYRSTYKTPQDYLQWILSTYGPNAPTAGGWQQLVDEANRIYGLQTGSSVAFDPSRGEKGIFEMPGGGYFSFDNGQWAFHQTTQETGGTSGPPSSFNDIYINSILARLKQLGMGANDPFRDLFNLSSLSRASDLFTKPPFTSQEDAALVAQYMNPLAQARDAAIQQAKESASARGMLPSSGLLADSTNKIQQGYEQSVAASSNDLAVRAVQQKQANQDKALSILATVEQLAQSGRAEDRQRAIDMLNTAQLLPNFDMQRLDELLKASGQPGDATSFLNSLFGANNSALNASGMTADAWGKFLGALLNNPALMQSIFGA
jgi:hypothetical protein